MTHLKFISGFYTMRSRMLYTVMALLLCIKIIHAQAPAKADSLLLAASLEIFNHPEKSIQTALKIYKHSGSNTPRKIRALVVVGNGYAAIEDREKAIKYVTQAYALAKSSKDTINQMRTLGLLASQYLQLEMNRKALDYLDIADKIGKTNTLPDSIRYLRGNIYLLKGLVYKHNRNCDFATGLFNKAITEFSTHSKNKAARANIGQAYSQKGFCEFEEAEYDSSKVSFNKAIEAGNVSHSNIIIASSLMGLAKISAVAVKNEQAITFLNKALTLAEETGSPGLKNDIYKELAVNYLAINDVHNHQKYEQLYTAAKIDIEQKEINTLNRDLKTTSQQTQAVFLKERNNYIFGSALLLVFTIAYTTYIIYRTRIQRKKVKEMHHNIISDK